MMTVQQAIDIMKQTGALCLIWDFMCCPLTDRPKSQHGGDEDYIVLYNRNEWSAEKIVDRITVCDYDATEIDDTYSIAITAHA